MNDKQLDLLIGISKSMEKSLQLIEKKLGGNSDVKGGKEKTPKSAVGGAALGGAAALLASTKAFDPKKSQSALKFITDITEVVSQMKPGKAKGFAAFAEGFSSAFGTLLEISSPKNLIKLLLAEKVLLSGKKPLLERLITGIASAMEKATGGKGGGKQMKQTAEAIDILAGGLMKLTKALAMVALIGIAAPLIAVGALVIWGVLKLFSTLGKNAKSLRDGARAIERMGRALVWFSAGLATFMLVMLIVTPKKIIGGLAILISFALTFYFLDKISGSIYDGAKSVALMGIAIFYFAVALATYMLVMMIASPKLVLGGIAVLVGLGLAFALLGKFSSSIIKGVAAIDGMGIALMLLAGGILAFGIAIKLLQVIFGDNLAMAGVIAGAILLGLGIAFSLIGLVAGPIAAGAAAMITVGFALMSISGGILLFGLAIKALQAIFGEGLAEAGAIGGAILLGLGLAFMLIGLVSPLVIAGGTAMMSVGFALLSISAGIMLFGLAIKALQSIFGDDLEEAGKIGGAILIGLGLAFMLLGVLSPFIILGAVAGIMMGVALLGVSLGLYVFGNTINGLIEKDLIDDDNRMKGTDVLIGMGWAFFDLGMVALWPMTWLGIAFAIGMGVSLMLISKGLSMAGDAMEAIPDIDVFVDNLFNLVVGVADMFATIGNKYGSFLSFLGADPVSLGIKSVQGMGAVLSELAGGIAAFANFEEFPVMIPDPDDPSRLIYSTVDVFKLIPKIQQGLTDGSGGSPGLLTSLADTFAYIGEKYGGGWFSDGPVQDGIAAIDGMGRVLSELAGGIVAFANFEKFPIQLPDPDDPSNLIYTTVDIWKDVIPAMEKNLLGSFSWSAGKGNPGLLNVLADTFAYIGEKYGDGWFSDGPVKKGIDAVDGMGKNLGEIAGGVVKFANFEKFPVEAINESGEKYWTTVNIWKEVIPQMKQNLMGKGKGTPGILMILADVFAEIGNKYAGSWWSDGPVKKGIDAVSGMGGVVSEIAGGIQAFADLKGTPIFNEEGKIIGYRKMNLPMVKLNMMKIIKVLPEIFKKVPLKSYEAAQAKAKVIQKLMVPISKIAKAYADMIVEDEEGKKNLIHELGTGINGFVEQIKGLKIDDPMIDSLKKLASAFKDFSKVGDLTGINLGVKDMGTSLGELSKGLAKIAPQLETFHSWKGDMSKLMWSSHKTDFDKRFVPGFGKMSKDMGVFSNNFKVMDEKAIEAFSLWTEALNTFSEINPSDFKTNITLAQDVNPFYKQGGGGDEPTKPTTPKNITDGSKKTQELNKPADGKNKDKDKNVPAPQLNIQPLIAAIVNLQATVQKMSDKFTNSTGNGIDVN